MATQSVSYSLGRHEAIGTGLIRLLNSMGQSARDLTGQPPAKLSESIHQLRVLIKRLRALLWFIRPILSAARYHRSPGHSPQSRAPIVPGA